MSKALLQETLRHIAQRAGEPDEFVSFIRKLRTGELPRPAVLDLNQLNPPKMEIDLGR